MNTRLDDILHRKDELTARLSNPNTASDPKEFARLSREFSELEPVANVVVRLKEVEQQIADNTEMLSDPDCDAEMREMAQVDIECLRTESDELHEQIKVLLLPKDPNDMRNAILEVRAGTGGDEAALFAANLFRMYCRFAERKGYRVEILSSNETGIGGYKEVVAMISGSDVFSQFKFESGVHRVQRVPETEAGGRIHTSACTVAILPEADEVDVQINNDDLRIDVFRASGPGGQSVNTTDSAVRITHIPSGLVVICQDEKSQHKNKAKAMKVLQARLFDAAQQEAHDERADMRRGMVGSGDRSERIRTYNYPQGRITDHRINLTLYKLEQILGGEMDELVDALTAHYQAELLAAHTG
ncbi:MAG: peptide chain release factor 1 [Zetaproteobacteria bacterium CG12_big_fil_rev_8_21_14_0_65_55_1124]|nr:MAG: peptide chain release factor 1 [Zetaproteobacteria bacterium CG1_02_55_237]PIS18437.1 MAG: peptide chain release factor 1 [Zetaproteobacteria bacterium CG08_land_8_20_14_0_20_55_17]PIW41813.1 MAG: peptide chain release factor 1 [Zetaproteobacteria bacterium CG12_big_fil_rev_8_21_14_0_65_55_1124]PIY51443.1 MAG: peptide chain release factor 1 [Zetaproteobacteria bacterium CG_4_10_14_0_8_um_filter_55_43]PIZ36616.1 MAG: peptide chain release factor 1 [Zetaproteobacteria bacterium CG_4_10_14